MTQLKLTDIDPVAMYDVDDAAEVFHVHRTTIHRSVFSKIKTVRLGRKDTATGEQLIKEFTAERSPYVTVLFEGDAPKPLEEGEQAYEPTYGIYIVVQNARPGAARKGDGDTEGTNLMRDRLRNALHDQDPKQSANGFYAGQTIFRGVQIVFQRKNAFIMRAELIVREDPVAS